MTPVIAQNGNPNAGGIHLIKYVIGKCLQRSAAITPIRKMMPIGQFSDAFDALLDLRKKTVSQHRPTCSLVIIQSCLEIARDEPMKGHIHSLSTDFCFDFVPSSSRRGIAAHFSQASSRLIRTIIKVTKHRRQSAQNIHDQRKTLIIRQIASTCFEFRNGHTVTVVAKSEFGEEFFRGNSQGEFKSRWNGRLMNARSIKSL